MLVVKAGVVNDPVVPVPPPPVEVHEVLLTDVQLMVVFVPFAIEEGAATTVTVGFNSTTFVFSVVVVPPPPPPPHDTRPETVSSTAKRTRSSNLEPAAFALLFDMILFLQ
ncbi:MAG: hypothetical protein ACOY9D_04375 [Pseudomonadota bacterium]